MTSYFPGIVLATLGLLVLTSSVTAESTWLLWNTYTETRSDPKTRSTEHAIVRAFDTQQACEQVVPSHVQAQIRTWGSVYERLRVSPTDPAVVIADGPKSPQTGSKDDALMIRVSCWPMGLKPKGILGGAAYVSEGSGWVLWKESSRPPALESWSLYEAYETRAECNAGGFSYGQISRKNGERPGMTREMKGGAIVTRENDTGKEIRREAFHCLPAGTDPRPRFKD